jgi:thymidylate synthase
MRQEHPSQQGYGPFASKDTNPNSPPTTESLEWTLLLEMVSYWLGQEPGRLVFFTSSMHLYEHHFGKARQLLDSNGAGPDIDVEARRPAFTTPWESFSMEMAEWMRVEAVMRSGVHLDQAECTLTDPLLTAYARMIDLVWAYKRKEGRAEIHQRLSAIRDTRLKAAANEFLLRAQGQHH